MIGTRRADQIRVLSVAVLVHRAEHAGAVAVALGEVSGLLMMLFGPNCDAPRAMAGHHHRMYRVCGRRGPSGKGSVGPEIVREAAGRRVQTNMPSRTTLQGTGWRSYAWWWEQLKRAR